MKLNRRNFLQAAQGTAAALVALGPAVAAGAEKADDGSSSHAYPYRIAFGAWIGDMRNTPLPLQKWPAPEFDEDAVTSFIQAMDVQNSCSSSSMRKTRISGSGPQATLRRGTSPCRESCT